MPIRYWFYQLKNLRLSELNKATAIPGLNREDAYCTKVYLAPLNEQKRITDKLDSLLARVDACRDRLDRVSLTLVVQKTPGTLMDKGFSTKRRSWDFLRNRTRAVGFSHYFDHLCCPS